MSNKIVINLFNHGAQSVLDTVLPIKCALEEIGFDVAIDNNYFGEELKLFVECFHYCNGSMQRMEQTQNFGIITSEFIDSKGFNSECSSEFSERFSNFSKIAPRARFLIANVQIPNINLWKQFAPTFVAEPEWHPKLDLSNNDDLIENDFCFYGVKSEKREKLIEELISKGQKVVYTYCQLSFEDRNKLAQSAKWVIGLKPRWDVEFASVTRISSAMFCQRPVAYEKILNTSRLTEIPIIHDSRNFADWLIEIKDKWKEERDRQVALFQKTSVTETVLKGLLDVGLIELEK